MKDYLNKYLPIVKKYIWLLIPFTFSAIFIVLIIITLLAQNNQQQTNTQPGSKQQNNNQQTPQITPIISPHAITPQAIPTASLTNETRMNEDGSIDEVWPTGFEDFYGDADPSSLQDVQKVENLPDGSQKYTTASSNPARPNIIIARNNSTIYQRKLPFPGTDIPLQNFTNIYGQADRVITGPAFYGSNATSEHIYAREGFAIVVNNQTRQVVEYHYFQPTTVDTYIRNFGNIN